MNNTNNYSIHSTNTSPKTKYKATLLDYKGLHFLISGAPEQETLSLSIQVSNLKYFDDQFIKRLFWCIVQKSSSYYLTCFTLLIGYWQMSIGDERVKCEGAC